MTKLTLVLSIVWNLLVFVITPVFMQFYALSDQTKYLIVILVLIHNIFNTVAFPFSGPLSNGLRATGDVKYTMIVSIASTVLGRFIFSIIFAIYFNMGVTKSKIIPTHTMNSPRIKGTSKGFSVGS